MKTSSVRTVTLITVLAACCVHGEAPAAVIRGTLRAPAAPEKRSFANPYPGRAGSMPVAEVRRGALQDAVIWIDGPAPAGRETDVTNAKTGQLAQKDQSFSPRVVPVVVGGQVDFPNRDPIYHNVFSVSPAKRFDLGKYGRGKSKSVRFDKPGVVKVYCDIHSNMEGFILVVPNSWFTRATDDGSFELPPLPAGSYRVQVWHPDLGSRSIPVTVGEDETRAIEVAF